ncbi:MAG TPA: hypothetical protein VN540_09525, partial [Clostridia bacterium]|nr:hypothetical protein [Clostridia bacterium]
YFYANMDDEVGTYTAHFGNEAISDGSSSMNVTDEGTDFTLEGVIYVTAAAAGRTWFLNPVYQAADGSVYAINGSGTSSSGDTSEGAAFWQTISAEYTVTQDGKTTTDSITAKIGIILMYVPERLRFIQFGSDGAVLTLEEYAPGTLPETIRPEADAAYLVVETYKTAFDGKTTVSRTLYERGAEYIDAYSAREDGICVKQATALDWGK